MLKAIRGMACAAALVCVTPGAGKSAGVPYLLGAVGVDAGDAPSDRPAAVVLVEQRKHIPDVVRALLRDDASGRRLLRGPLGFVVTLAGYQATPAEEMPVAEPAQAPAPAAPPVSAERADEINALITKALESGAVDGGRLAMTFQRAGWVGTAINGETAAELTDVMADKVQASLEADLKAAKS